MNKKQKIKKGFRIYSVTEKEAYDLYDFSFDSTTDSFLCWLDYQ